MQTVEEFDGFLGGRLMPMDGHRSTDDLLHAAADGPCIIERHRAPDVQVYIISVRHGDVDGHLTRIEQFVRSLAEHKEECSGIGSVAARRGDIQEFHLLLLIDSEVHAFHLVIHMCRDGSVPHLKSRQLIHFLEVCT